MKILIAVVELSFVICSVAASHEDGQANMMEYFKECMEENEDIKQELEDVRMKKIMPDQVSESFKCAMKCIMDKYEIINTDTGELLPEEFKAKFIHEAHGANDLDKVVEACKDSKGENPCDTAYTTMMCMASYNV